MDSGSETQAARDELVRSLTLEMQGGSQAAFARFYNLVYDCLYRMLLAQTKGDEDLTKELIQAVMIRTARHLPLFRNERLLWGWLRQVARSCHVDWTRRKGREPQCVGVGIFNENLAAVDPAKEDETELLQALEWSLSQLDSSEREALHLAYFEGVTHQSMADKFHTSAKAIESKLGRIRQKLRRILLEKMKDYALL